MSVIVKKFISYFFFFFFWSDHHLLVFCRNLNIPYRKRCYGRCVSVGVDFSTATQITTRLSTTNTKTKWISYTNLRVRCHFDRAGRWSHCWSSQRNDVLSIANTHIFLLLNSFTQCFLTHPLLSVDHVGFGLTRFVTTLDDLNESKLFDGWAPGQFPPIISRHSIFFLFFCLFFDYCLLSHRHVFFR